MRGFLNIIFILLVAGIALIALSPLVVLTLEISQDPHVMGIECSVSGDKVIARAWYRGSLNISNAVLSASLGNITIGSSAAHGISRERNITLEAAIPRQTGSKEDLVINLSITLEGLYKAGLILRGCGL